MIELIAANVTEEWFSITPKYEENSIEVVREKGAIKDIFGGENIIWLGKPVVTNLLDITPDSYKKRLEAQIGSYDFFLMQFTCSFRPHQNCEFTRVSVNVHLVSDDKNSEALAHDMFPEEVYMPVTYKKGFSVNPDFKMEVAKVLQTEVSAFNYSNEKEFIIYQPEITAFAKGTESPGWDFNKSSARSIKGNKDLFLIIRKTKGSQIKIGIEILNCYIRTMNLGPLPLSNLVIDGVDGPLISKQYILK